LVGNLRQVVETDEKFERTTINGRGKRSTWKIFSFETVLCLTVLYF